jgi:FkbM family methyltransferase
MNSKTSKLERNLKKLSVSLFRLTSGLPFLDIPVRLAIKSLHSKFGFRILKGQYVDQLRFAYQAGYKNISENRKRKVVQLKFKYSMSLDHIDTLGGLIYFYGDYSEEKTRKILIDTLKEGDTFFDVGSNLGYFSLLAGSLVGKNGHVFPFEPNKYIAGYLDDSFTINKLPYKTNVVAVSDMPDQEVRFYVQTANETVTGSISKKEGAYETMVVKTTTIDDFVQKHGIKHTIKLMKIDVEGAEELVIKGMRQTLRDKQVEKVIIETSRDSGVIALMEGYNYACSPIEVWDSTSGFGNYLFCR